MRLRRREVLVGGLTLLGCTTKSSAVEARVVSQLVPSMPTIDGAGVRLHRALGSRALPLLDPFLLFDEFKSDDANDYLAGFPEHPHRGFETVTYMVHGAMEHRDSVGNSGRLRPGSAQWMTAGHGIVHSEMPKQDHGLMWGYQLWVNLPRSRKLMAPRYQDLAPETIPEVTRADGSHLRVVAGKTAEATGPVTGIDADPLFLDVTLGKGAELRQAIPFGHTSFLLAIDGAVRVGTTEVRAGNVAVLTGGSLVQASGVEGGGRALLLAGRPFNEPVARSGPFVMNTEDELKQAWADYRAGVLTTG
jgi:redox-sensitive bicupin YhaK (pirin superfamily)